MYKYMRIWKMRTEIAARNLYDGLERLNGISKSDLDHQQFNYSSYIMWRSNV